MAQDKHKDQLADLLASMADGTAHDPLAEHPQPAPAAPAPPAPPRPPAPPALPPRTAAPRPAAPARPAAPVAPRPAVPSRPAEPVTSDAPQADPALQPAPMASADQPSDEQEEQFGHITEDDDMGIAPTPTEVIARPAPAPARRVALVQTTEFKRTIIPLMLVLGITLPLLVAMGHVMDEDSAFLFFRGGIGWWLLGLGAVLLTAGVVTMFQVRHELGRRTDAQQQAARPR